MVQVDFVYRQRFYSLLVKNIVLYLNLKESSDKFRSMSGIFECFLLKQCLFLLKKGCLSWVKSLIKIQCILISQLIICFRKTKGFNTINRFFSKMLTSSILPKYGQFWTISTIIDRQTIFETNHNLKFESNCGQITKWILNYFGKFF